MSFVYVMNRILPNFMALIAIFGAMVSGYQGIRVEVVALYELGLFIAAVNQIYFLKHEIDSLIELYKTMKKETAK